MRPDLGVFVRLWGRVQRPAHRVITAAHNLFVRKPVRPVGFDLSHPVIVAQLAQVARHQRTSQLNTESLPSEEQPYCRIVRAQLGNLETWVTAFGAAVELYDMFSSGEKADLRFMQMACRDGTMSLWNFATALNAIKASLDAAPTLRTKMRVGQVDAARSQFWRALPHTEGLRNATGHTSELMKSPQQWDRNALKGGRVNDQINIGTNSFWIGNIIGRRYSTTTFDGKLVEYEMSTATLDTLRLIMDEVFGAILPPPPRPAPPK